MFGKKSGFRGWARGKNKNQKKIYGRDNINYEGPTPAWQEEFNYDDAVARSDWSAIASDFTEVTQDAAVAYLEGDMDNYYRLLDSAAQVYASHRTWDHFAKTYPEKVEMVNQWRRDYDRFRSASGLTEDHESLSVTDRYQNMNYHDVDMETAVEGVKDAIHQMDRMNEARAAYKRRVKDKQPRQEPQEDHPQNDGGTASDPDPFTQHRVNDYGLPEDGYFDNVPPRTVKDISDILAFYGEINKRGVQKGTVIDIMDAPHPRAIMNKMVEDGVFEHVGGNTYAYSGDSRILTESRAKLWKEQSIAKNYESHKKFSGYDNKALKDIQKLNELLQGGTIRETNGKYMMTVPDAHDGSAEHVYLMMESNGIITHRGMTESGRHLYELNMSKEDFNSFSQDALYEDKLRKAQKQARTESSGGGSNQPPHEPPNSTPPSHSGPAGDDDKNNRSGGENSRRSERGQYQQSSGENPKKAKSTKNVRDSQGKEHPILRRTTNRMESSLGVSSFGSTRMTGRKRVGPFVINTGVNGVMGVSSVSLNIGPVMWSLWSKDYNSGFSSIDLPGMFSFRGKRTRKNTN